MGDAFFAFCYEVVGASIEGGLDWFLVMPNHTGAVVVILIHEELVGLRVVGVGIHAVFVRVYLIFTTKGPLRAMQILLWTMKHSIQWLPA